MRFFLPLAVGLLCASLSQPLLAQVCPSTGIKTDPQAPAYNPDPARVNTFNWYQGPYYSGRQYALNSPVINQSTIWLPWEQPNNPNVERILGKRDMPIDGWELVRRDLGYDNAGTKLPDTYNPYVILYNRYQGMLRVFVAVGVDKPGYNFAEIKLLFSTVASKKAGTLNRQAALGVALEDTEPGPGGELTAISTYLNVASTWFMADFPMDYDPCVCLFDSKLRIDVRLISEANVKLVGETSGTLVTTGGTNTTSTGPSYSKGIPFIRKVNNTISAGGKTYDNIDKLTTAMTGKKGADSGALGALNTALKKSDFLKAGLSNLPWVGTAVALLDFFLTGGKDGSSGSPISLQPMTIEMSTTTTGTITSNYLYAFTAFHNPGNRLSKTIEEEVPFYNEAMGVFSLLKRPTVEVRTTPNYAGSNLVRFSFRLPDDLQYVINPAAGLDVQDFQAALVFEGASEQMPTRPFYDFGGIQTYEGVTVQANGYTSNAYRTDYTDALFIKNNIYSYTWNQTGSTFQHSNVYVKILLNLRPRNCSTCQNVLYVARYPVTIKDVSTYASLPTASSGVLPQASAATVSAVCNGSKYLTAVALRTSLVGVRPSGKTALEEASLSVFPNPATTEAHLHFTLTEAGPVRLSVYDALGRQVLLALDETRDAGAHDAVLNTATLAPGIYSCRLQAGGHQLTKKLAVTH